jgi:hypothetical protein
MLSAVDFDDQPTFEADQIDDVRPDRPLPTELERIKAPTAQLPPQAKLCLSRILAQVARPIQTHPRKPANMCAHGATLTLPSPAGGRGFRRAWSRRQRIVSQLPTFASARLRGSKYQKSSDFSSAGVPLRAPDVVKNWMSFWAAFSPPPSLGKMPLSTPCL